MQRKSRQMPSYSLDPTPHYSYQKHRLPESIVVTANIADSQEDRPESSLDTASIQAHSCFCRVSYMPVPDEEEDFVLEFPTPRKMPTKWIILFYLLLLILTLFCPWTSAQNIIQRCFQDFRKHNFTGTTLGVPLNSEQNLRESVFFHVSSFSCLLMNLAVPELIYFVADVCNEWVHLSTRHYQGKIKMVRFVWTQHRRLNWLLVVGVTFFAFSFVVCEDYVWFWLQFQVFFSIISLLYFYSILNKGWTASELDTISCNMSTIGRTIAIGYYFGFLRLVLYNTLADSLTRRIENFIEENHIPECKFPVKKMFIILPVSCSIQSDLAVSRNDGKVKLEYFKQLRPKVLERGVNRSYNNTVYRISPYDVYVVAEVATPLLTLYDMSMSSTCKFLSKEDRLEQFYLFCTCLDEILKNDRSCDDTYVLVYFNDSVPSSGRCLANVIYQYLKNECEMLNININEVPHSQVRDIEIN